MILARLGLSIKSVNSAQALIEIPLLCVGLLLDGPGCPDGPGAPETGGGSGRRGGGTFGIAIGISSPRSANSFQDRDNGTSTEITSSAAALSLDMLMSWTRRIAYP
jgi:hypothetical protein